MEYFPGQLLAFPMYAAGRLAAVGRQPGIGRVGAVLGVASGFVLLGFAGWCLGVSRGLSRRSQRIGGAGALAAIGLAFVVLLGIETIPGAPAEDHGAEAFTPARLAKLRAEGRPVFVNLTAAWCVTCLVNERGLSVTIPSGARSFQSMWRI